MKNHNIPITKNRNDKETLSEIDEDKLLINSLRLELSQCKSENIDFKQNLENLKKNLNTYSQSYNEITISKEKLQSDFKIEISNKDEQILNLKEKFEIVENESKSNLEFFNKQNLEFKNKKNELEALLKTNEKIFESKIKSLENQLFEEKEKSSQLKLSLRSLEETKFERKMDKDLELKYKNLILEKDEFEQNASLKLKSQLFSKDEEINNLKKRLSLIENESVLNFSILEQMKQQVLKEKAELTKKLSQTEPDAANKILLLEKQKNELEDHCNDLMASVSMLIIQKNEIISQLANEIKKNTTLVKMNSIQEKNSILNSENFSETSSDSSKIKVNEIEIENQLFDAETSNLDIRNNLVEVNVSKDQKENSSKGWFPFVKKIWKPK